VIRRGYPLTPAPPGEHSAPPAGRVASPGDSERLRVLPSAGGVGYDLRLGGSDGSIVATLCPPPHVVLLDARLLRGDGSARDVVTSEFDVALQRGRVVRWPSAGPVPCSLFEGPPGSVLWWLHERDGHLEVRDVRSGRTYEVDGDPGRAPTRRPA
jgi:hypothetical protein